MKKIIYAVFIVVIQHSTLSIQNSFGQAPFNTPDNIGSGNCLELNGNEDLVNINNDAVWNNTFAGNGKKFSLSAWINIDVAGTQNMIVVKTADNSCPTAVGERQFAFMTDGTGRLVFLYYSNLGLGGSLHRIVSGNTVLTAQKWHHVAITYDGSINTNDGLDRVNLYVDGVAETTFLSASNGTLGDIQSGPAPLVIGNRVSSLGERCDDGDREFDGKMDEVQIWNKLLTQSEIKDNMCKKLIGNESNLVGYWAMNEGTGVTVNDLTSNANHGTRQ